MSNKDHLSDGARIMRHELIKYLERTAPATTQVLGDMVTDSKTPAVKAGRSVPIAQPRKAI